MISVRRKLLLLVAAGLMAATATAAHAADRIGVASAVQRDVTGTLASQVRTLSPGNGVFGNERIATREKSTAQLLFLDETSLSIGPVSEVVLDRFVYNPGGTAEEVSVEAVKGAFRFVSGSSNSQSYKVKTPLATIGVRGTVFDLVVQASKVIVILVEGAVDVCVDGTCTGIVRPGRFIVVRANGSMEGPRRWDDSLRNVLGKVSFPLFGNHLDADRSRPYGITDARSRVDEIETRAQERFDRRFFDDDGDVTVTDPDVGVEGRRRR